MVLANKAEAVITHGHRPQCKYFSVWTEHVHAGRDIYVHVTMQPAAGCSLKTLQTEGLGGDYCIFLKIFQIPERKHCVIVARADDRPPAKQPTR